MRVECVSTIVRGIPGLYRCVERFRRVRCYEPTSVASEWSPSAASRGNQPWRGSHRPTGCAIFPELPPVGWGSSGSVIGSG